MEILKARLYAYRCLYVASVLLCSAFFLSLFGGWNPNGIFMNERFVAVKLAGYRMQDMLGFFALGAYLGWLIVGLRQPLIMRVVAALLAVFFGFFWFMLLGLFLLFALAEGPIAPFG